MSALLQLTERERERGLHFRKVRRAQSVHDFETWQEDTVTNTINTFDTGEVRATDLIVDATVRRLTPLECERLQGFPDGWTAERYDYKKQQVVPQADSARYKQMGNAVAVPVFAWVMGRLAVAHEAATEQADVA